MSNFEGKNVEPISNTDVLLDEYNKLLAGRKEDELTDPVVLANLENLKRSLRVASHSEANTDRELSELLSNYEAKSNLEIKNILNQIGTFLKSVQSIKDNILANILPKCGPTQHKIISSELNDLSTSLIQSMEEMQTDLQAEKLDLPAAQKYLTQCAVVKNKFLNLYAKGREIVGD